MSARPASGRDRVGGKERMGDVGLAALQLAIRERDVGQVRLEPAESQRQVRRAPSRDHLHALLDRRRSAPGGL